jgi:hypothetical protein
MDPIGPVPLQVVDATIVGRITGIPAGPARTVSVSARDSRGLAVYEGSAQVDVVAGRSVAASRSSCGTPRTARSCRRATST